MPKYRKISGRANVWELTSYIADVNREIQKGERRNRLKATRYITKKLKQEVKNKYGEGNLYKGIDYVHYDDLSKFGFTKPAQHAHLIEFGTDERFVKNYRGHKGVYKSVGRMKNDKPVFRPVVLREAANVGKILAEPFIK